MRPPPTEEGRITSGLMLTDVPSLTTAYCGDGDGVGTEVRGTVMEWENYRGTKWEKVNFSEKGFSGMNKVRAEFLSLHHSLIIIIIIITTTTASATAISATAPLQSL